ncbi:50S ribosomal protein L17 [Neoehrlichia mikurensis]|uniref:Large ribosomal subunit protein bL17 n=1 Tax=Neoehrlichia mikurensis TaxID=89586 RepID=A0A9Q9BSS7_9RICK|nr:50S ribosomal protein L17 [Neoehrlichia mikurensis]QXK91813.1 50S ribosomal protein L17 [Neoehrlichia mikurensis]QXK93026.1 50S ribosomal protein L17 [Neoehrlichia mikurensis]QXK93504.1 50S ribosomal protein L17 [Neoehrlichia mikurensis]UTO55542.1 50S ribosomal protein L17 [Neoehrlichia mikurensis]UTO56463.1 50S ribosomal protein L17 [Neoehrlichia mikurensis]
MKHRIKHRKFCRTSSHRASMLRNLSISLLKHERIVTTLPKAKDLRPYVEKLISIAKNYKFKDNVYGRRLLVSKLHNLEIINKLMDSLADRYKDRNGGYIRIIKYGFRKGDSAPIAIIELVDNVKKTLTIAN